MKISVYSIILVFLITLMSSCGDSKQKRRELTHKSLSSSLSSSRPRAIVKRSKDTKVVITSEATRLGKEMSGTEIFELYNTAVFMIFTSDGWSRFQGSGFFISCNGIAVSNYHIFKGTTIGHENIKLVNGEMYKVEEVIDYSEDEDYIIFKVGIGNRKMNYIPLTSKNPKVGEPAFAIGSPRGLENTFSSGEISQIRENNVLQISVPIDHGSSGGVLLNKYGEAMGITTAGRDDSGANLNFAMSIKVLNKSIR